MSLIAEVITAKGVASLWVSLYGVRCQILPSGKFGNYMVRAPKPTNPTKTSVS